MTDQTATPIHDVHSGLTEEKIARLVATFYSRAREDDLIGPIFNAAVKDWDHHIAQISDFWSSMMMKTGRYNGRPMRPHLVLPLRGEHFDRWLSCLKQPREKFSLATWPRPSSSAPAASPIALRWASRRCAVRS